MYFGSSNSPMLKSESKFSSPTTVPKNPAVFTCSHDAFSTCNLIQSWLHAFPFIAHHAFISFLLDSMKTI